MTGQVPTTGVTFQVFPGNDVTTMLGSNGKLYAWGLNSYGQAGDGSVSNRSTPVPVNTSALPSPALPFLTVAAGGSSMYGVGQDGNLYSWGANNFAQLGDGTKTARRTPVPVTTSAAPAAAFPFQSVVGGSYAAYALGADGKVYAWGSNSYGQLGDGTITERRTPVPVSTATVPAAALPFTAVAAGTYAAYALGTDGNIYAWGDNIDGQLGDATTTGRRTPVPVSTSALPAGALPFTAVAARAGTVYGLGSDGNIYAWGSNTLGQVGDGTTTARQVPVPVSTSAVPAAALPFTAVAAGLYGAYGLGTDGNVYAWGWNDYGQVGDGTTSTRLAPVVVDASGLPAQALPFTSVSAGSYTGNAVGADGNVYAWGWNEYGQVGDGTAINRSAPVQVTGLGATVLEVTFGGVPGTNLSQSGGTWQVTAPAGCGPVDVEVTYHHPLDPAGVVRSVVDADGFVFGAPPSIVSEPVSATVAAGGTFTATVDTSDDCKTDVQWQASTDGTTWTDLPGQTAEVLTVAGVATTTHFRALVTNCWTVRDPAYMATSAVVTVTVEQAGGGGDGGNGAGGNGGAGGAGDGGAGDGGNGAGGDAGNGGGAGDAGGNGGDAGGNGGNGGDAGGNGAGGGGNGDADGGGAGDAGGNGAGAGGTSDTSAGLAGAAAGSGRDAGGAGTVSGTITHRSSGADRSNLLAATGSTGAPEILWTAAVLLVAGAGSLVVAARRRTGRRRP